MRTLRWMVVAVLTTVTLGGCGGDTTDEVAPTPTAQPSATAGPTGTAEPSPTAEPSVTAEPSATAEPSPAPTTDTRFVRTAGFPSAQSTDGPHGSGCAPGPGPLPDGVWFGIGRALSPTSIDFDLACFYTGDPASEQAAERGLEAPPPNDYLIVNDVDTVRAESVAGDAVAWRATPNPSDAEAVSPASFIADPGPYMVCPGDTCLLWLYVNDGVVTEFAGQFVP